MQYIVREKNYFLKLTKNEKAATNGIEFKKILCLGIETAELIFKKDEPTPLIISALDFLVTPFRF